MTVDDFLDSSVLIAALVAAQPHHAKCAALVKPRAGATAHALLETFAFLTGRMTPRLRPADAVALIREALAEPLEIFALSGAEHLATLKETAARGITGGAIYDYLHMAAARKAKARRLCTLNVRHFQAFHRAGDPEIAHP